MDNHERRVRYVMQNTGLGKDAAHALVTDSYTDRSVSLGLKPGQRRRISRGMAKRRSNPNTWRGRNPQVVIMDELPQVTEIRAGDLRFPPQMATRPRMTGKVRQYIDARLAQNVRRAVARGR